MKDARKTKWLDRLSQQRTESRGGLVCTPASDESIIDKDKQTKQMAGQTATAYRKKPLAAPLSAL